jgi:protocatechuate 3,4-dioxygenase alpha subunit
MKLTPSGSQTVGPFFRIGLEHLYSAAVKPIEHSEMVTVFGKVIDSDGAPVPDAVLELWHADDRGRYAESFEGSGRSVCFTRTATDDQGRFEFSISKPGTGACEPEFKQAPHLSVLVFARGLLRQLMTRIYFPGETANGSDSLLQMVPEDRRGTLIAREAGGGANAYEWNVVLQGRDETVFFAW